MKSMAESVKVDADAFKEAIRALLNAKPTPMADIPRKREPGQQKARKSAKKRG
jgi:hypothetical protein